MSGSTACLVMSGSMLPQLITFRHTVCWSLITLSIWSKLTLLYDKCQPWFCIITEATNVVLCLVPFDSLSGASLLSGAS